MAWRKAATTGPAAPAVAEMLGYAAEYERAGDAVRLASVRSYLDMLALAGDDDRDAAALAELFLVFARDHHRGVA